MKFLATAAMFCLAGVFLSGAERAELDQKRDELLSEKNLAAVRAVDPLTGEWLAGQRRILGNLSSAVAGERQATESLKADYEYLLSRIAEEIDWTLKAQPIDESKVYNVKEFGAKGDGSADDGEAIRKAIAAAEADTMGKRTVFLPRGRYLVRNSGNSNGNLKLEKLNNLRILGERGTEILIPGPLDVAVQLTGCENVGLKSLTFTYLTPPYTTGVITGFPAEGTIRIEIDPGMAAPTERMFKQAQTKGLMRFYSAERIPGSLRPMTSSIAPHQMRPEVTKVDDRTYDFKVNSFTPVSANYAPGSRVAFYARTYGNHVINNAYSNRTRLENLVINTSSAMAILNNSSERPFVVNCRVEALPGSFVSTSADGIYMRNISLGGLVKGNIVRNIGDDFMNIHTLVHPAVKAEGKTLFLKKQDWNPRYLASGRRLGLIRTSIGQSGVAEEARIIAVTEDGDLFKVTLDREFKPFATVDSGSKLPDMLILPDNQSHGLIVTGNRFENGVSRFLAGGRNWLFTDNVVIDSLSHSFFMNFCPEPVGRGGGEFVSPRNIEISGNRFETTGKTLFRFGGSANRFIPADQSLPSASHIKIIDNEIEIDGSSPRPLIAVVGVEDLTISGNTVRAAIPQGGCFVEQTGGRAIKVENNSVTGNLKH